MMNKWFFFLTWILHLPPDSAAFTTISVSRCRPLPVGGRPTLHPVHFSSRSRGCDKLTEDESLGYVLPETKMQPGSSEEASTRESVSSTKNPLEAPSLKQILRIAIPAIGIWLCSPLLSLIDTSTVGLLAGTAEQAALNPAVAVTDYSARLMSFLYTGTTNLVASCRDSERESVENPKTSQTLIAALQMSLLVGGGLAALLLCFTLPLLRGIIGSDAIPGEVFDAAMRYVRIRALGMPAAALIGSSQAACLGLQDVKSPLVVILIAAAVNLVADIALVGRSSNWIGGAAGAAWATTMSQYVAVAVFLKWFCAKKTKTRNPPAITLKDDTPPPFSIKGFLAGKVSVDTVFRRPSRKAREGFSPYIIPVTTTQVGRCSTYVAMNHVVSSSFGTISMAANQIVMAIFYALIPVADSLSLTAQSLLPAIIEREPSPARSDALKQTIWNFLKAAGVFGVVLSGIVGCIPFAGRLFTTDSNVISLVNSIVPLLLVIFSLHGVFCASEGILLGQRDLSFLGRMYALYFVVVPTIMLQVKRAALAGSTKVGLLSVWKIFLGYQLFRITAWVGRVVALLQRKTHQQKSVTTEYGVAR